MSTKEKALGRILEVPCRTDITLNEIKTVAEHLELDIHEGSSHTVLSCPGTDIIVPIPRHSKTVKTYVIKQIQELIQEKESIGE